MLELYFIFYRIPKMMTQLAREKNRSAVAWSLLGIGAWIGAEFAVGALFGLVQVVGSVWFGWSETNSGGLNVIMYICALAAALGSSMLVARILRNKDTTESYPRPPAPPNFSGETNPPNLEKNAI